MEFKIDKKNSLSKIDRSKKGSIDKNIKKIILLINKHKNYFTTSSCSGRIMIYTKSNKKSKSNWYFVSHEKIKFQQINIETVYELKDKIIWFKQESFILHLRAKDIKSAENILKIARDLGLKKSGIKTINKKINIEIVYHLGFDIPIKINEEKIDINFLNKCINIANDNLETNFKKINEFETELEKLF